MTPERKLLPGELPQDTFGKGFKFQCFICKDIVGIFSQTSVGAYCVCHRCQIRVVVDKCKDLDRIDHITP